jgi:gamma-glutamyltranspeptidase/glutathione hydrolase
MAWFKRQGSTTHFDVVDGKGNAVGCTHSLGSGFGGGITVPGTGITLNNFMRWSDIDPSNPAAAQPGGRASEADISVMSPVFVLDTAGALEFCLGSPGSYGIPQTQTQLLLNVLDFGMSMQGAIEAPRVRLPETSPGEPAAGWLEVVAEARLPAETQAELTRRGHQLDMQPDWTAAVGGMQGIAIQADEAGNRWLSGGADPRRDGYVIGW